MALDHILNKLGSTPVIQLGVDWNPNLNLYVKLEFLNPTGSVKDRAASYILQKLLKSGEIDRDTVIVESTSGNFGVALSAYCRKYGLRFIAVVDPHITPVNEMLIRAYGGTIVKVDTPDKNGGYLLNRIEKVKQLTREISNSYWVNQYCNPYNADAYYHSLGTELCAACDNLDYVFIGVSSGGTIVGVSRKVKEVFPRARVVAVDIVGSVIFGNPPSKRYIPGIGSSMVPDILKHGKIDEVVMMDESSTIRMCHELLQKHIIFAGGSSGSALAAVKQYFCKKKLDRKVNVVTILADRGERYMDTIYNKEWYTDFLARKTG